jgi:probable F420-dependent oxidoreductase
MKIGAVMFFTEYSMGPAALGRALEERGFESLWVPEHSHIPLSRKTPYPAGGPLIRPYYDIMDPFLALNTAAAVTTRLKIGTGVCLVNQRDPIHTAKLVSSIDQLSNGRFLFGVGNGWNQDEMENHGTVFATRHKLSRERIEAMKAIWTQDEPDYHGEFVNFDKMNQWPKPVQKPHPPILVGGNGPHTLERVVEYGDGWMPVNGREGPPVGPRIPELQALARAAGRDPIPVTIFEISPDPAEIEAFRAAGAVRGLFHLPSAGRDELLPLLDRLTEVKAQFEQG